MNCGSNRKTQPVKWLWRWTSPSQMSVIHLAKTEDRQNINSTKLPIKNQCVIYVCHLNQ